MAKNELAKSAEVATPVPYERKKLTAEYINLAELAETKTLFVGTFLGKKTGPWIDKKSGEEKTLTRLIFDRRDPHALNKSLGRVIVFEDAGLRKGMEDSMVQVGDTNEIGHLGKTDIGQGRTVNQYEVYSVESPLLPKRVTVAQNLSDVA